MAHFAKIDENNIVENVIVVHNTDVMNLEFPESEVVGLEFLSSIGLDGRWLQTSINTFAGVHWTDTTRVTPDNSKPAIRKNYAAIGGTYDEDKDAFIYPKPYPSWELDDNLLWMPPVKYPEDGNLYSWNESTLSWDFVEIPIPE
jgi:hypothetical protein